MRSKLGIIRIRVVFRGFGFFLEGRVRIRLQVKPIRNPALIFVQGGAAWNIMEKNPNGATGIDMRGVHGPGVLESETNRDPQNQHPLLSRPLIPVPPKAEPPIPGPPTPGPPLQGPVLLIPGPPITEPLIPGPLITGSQIPPWNRVPYIIINFR